MKTILAAAVAALALVGCSSANPHHLTGGTVIDKGQQAAFDFFYQMPMPHEQCFSGYKGAETCTTYFTYIPILMHQDATWWIKVQDCVTPRQKVTGHCYTGKLYLTPDEWAAVKIGEQYGMTTADRTAPPTHKASA